MEYDTLSGGYTYTYEGQTYKLFVDGFDYYEADRLPLKWQIADNLTITQNGRGGGGCLEPLEGGYTLESVPLNVDCAVLGFALYLAEYKDMAFQFGAAGVLISEGYISITDANGMTLAGTSTSALPLGKWNYVEIGVTADLVEVYVNNNDLWVSGSATAGPIPSVTLTNTVNGTAAGSWRIDHLYLTYGSEAYWVGPCRISVVEVVADASPQDWTPSDTPAWQQVSDWPGSISSEAIGATSRFTLGELPADTIAVQLNAYGTGSVLVAGVVDDITTEPHVFGETESLLRDSYFLSSVAEIGVTIPSQG